LAGVDGFIVPSAWIARPVRGLPHMFTDEELAAFFRAADSIDAEYRSPFREYTIPVIFRLILGAGLRPPEARRLRRRDVDAEGAMVVIERSKRNKDRRVPVSRDLAGLLARFDHLADLRRPDRGSGSLRTSMAVSTPRPGSSPATTAAASLRAGSRRPRPLTRCGTITPPAP
jgi:integrase